MKNYIITSLLTLGALSASAQSTSLSDTSRGNGFNPSIGLNALTLYKNSARDNDHDGFQLQEAEIQFSADVDAYFRAEATFAIHPEHEVEEEAGHEGHGYAFEPEEIFAETISIPDVTVKIGKFYTQFGKYNMVHTHAQPFIYRGVVQEYMFGEEGLNEVGVGVSTMLPLPWFSDLTVQFIQPSNEELFHEDPHSIATVANLKNLWDLSESLTLEWGLSGLYYNHRSLPTELRNRTTVLGSDLTFKWKPVKKGKYSSFVWSTEFIHKDIQGENELKNGGVSTFFRYQLAQRWYAQAQYEFLGLFADESLTDTNVYTGLIAFVPTEFSSLRVQYDDIHDGEDHPEKRVSLQLSFSIGAHPAHVY
ncbi:hypothetical protein [Halobacteriovorax sp.]|uniref:hypothetical protein n=1 Tax=Halobacteriovorax sp. TaxID=2020862 RepID=UPI003AF308EE